MAAYSVKLRRGFERRVRERESKYQTRNRKRTRKRSNLGQSEEKEKTKERKRWERNGERAAIRRDVEGRSMPVSVSVGTEVQFDTKNGYIPTPYSDRFERYASQDGWLKKAKGLIRESSQFISLN